MVTELRDLLIAPWWVATTSLLALAAWKSGRRLFPTDGFHQVVLHGLVMAWGSIVLVATLLGLASALTGITLLSGVTLLAGTILCILPGRRLSLANTSDSPPPFSAAEPASRDDRRNGVWRLLWLLLLSFALGHIVIQGLLTFPTDRDSLMYHLPMIDYWIQARSLFAPDSYWFNPGNNELLGFWLTAPFSGDYLVAMNNLTPACLLAPNGYSGLSW